MPWLQGLASEADAVVAAAWAGVSDAVTGAAFCRLDAVTSVGR